MINISKYNKWLREKGVRTLRNADLRDILGQTQLLDLG
jgi:hypothetical protein